MTITLTGDYEYNYQQALRRVVHNIQTQFDINPEIIQKWFDRENFDQVLEKKDRGCYRKIMSQPNELLEKLLDVAYADTFINEHLFWETEKCGQIMDEFSNGYIKYCNKHKYLHPDRKTLTRNKQETQEDHFFVTKNPNEIMEEQIFKIRFNIYLKYNRLFAQIMENEFYQFLENNLHYSTFYADFDQGKELVEWLRTHPFSFKSKFPTYRESKNHKVNDPNEKVYIKVYLAENEEHPDFKLISSNML